MARAAAGIICWPKCRSFWFGVAPVETKALWRHANAYAGSGVLIWPSNLRQTLPSSGAACLMGPRIASEPV